MTRRLLLPVILIGAMLAFIYLPVIVLVLFSLHDGRVPVPPFEGPTLEWYQRLLDNPRIVAATGRSVMVGIISSAISVALALLAAAGLARSEIRGKRAIEALLLLPLAVSTLVIGVGLMVMFGTTALGKSLALVTLGHVVLNLPLAFAILYAQFDPAQTRLEAAARDLGATEIQVFFRVTVPTLRIAIAAAFLLCFTFSWDEFIVAFLVSGFDPTLPMVIWSLLRTGLDPQTNAAGSLVFLVSIAAAIAFELALVKGRRRDAIG